ncbi:MAG: TetR/AcrR family transcriptional regulator [Sandaracinaceae bacterium]
MPATRSIAARKRLPGPERRRQLASAALSILAKHGATKLTARALGDAVGLTDGAIFRHFPNKAAIVDAAIERFEGFLAEDLPDANAPPMEQLESFFVKRLAKLRAHPEVLKLTFSDRLEQAAGPAGAARIREGLGAQRAFLFRCVGAARDAGELDGRGDVALLTWMVMGTMQGAARSPEPPPAEVFRQLKTVLGTA